MFVTEENSIRTEKNSIFKSFKVNFKCRRTEIFLIYYSIIWNVDFYILHKEGKISEQLIKAGHLAIHVTNYMNKLSPKLN